MNSIVSLPSLREILGVAFCYKWRILLAFMVPVAAAFGLSLWLQPLYRAESLVLVRPGHEYMPPSEEPHSAEMPPQVTMQETLDNEIAILTSNDLISTIVDQVGPTTLYPGLNTAGTKMTPDKLAGLRLEKDLSVSPVKLSTVIEITLRNANRAVAVSTLQLILKEFERLHLTAFHRDRSSVLEEDLNADNQQLAQLEAQQASYMNARGLFSFAEQRSELLQQRASDVLALLTANIDQAALSKQLAFLRQALTKEPETIVIAAGDQQTPILADARKRVEELREQLQAMLVSYRRESSYVQPTLTKLGVAENELAALTDHKQTTSSVTRGPNPIVAMLRQQIITAESNLAPVNAKIAVIKDAIAADDKRLAGLTDQSVGLKDLDRRIAQLTQAADKLRERLIDARFLEALDKAGIASLSVIQQPVAMVNPVFPQKSLLVLASMVVGLICSMFVLLLALTTGNRFLMIETVERVLAIPTAVGLPALTRRQMREIGALTSDTAGTAQIASAGS